MTNVSPRTARPGFTLTELMVSVAIAAILMTLISYVFHTAQKAVSLSIANGRLLVESEAVGEQIKHDADRMLGPIANHFMPIEDAGFLAIVNKSYQTPLYVSDAGTEEVIRSDQLAFVVQAPDGHAFRSLTPEDDTTLASDVTAREAVVWYGHAEKTTAQGDIAGNQFGNTGRANPNEDPHQWIFARQQTLLAGDSIDYTASTDPPTHVFYHYGWSQNGSTTVEANWFGGDFEDEDDIYDHLPPSTNRTGWPWPNIDYSGAALRAAGLSDVANATLEDVLVSLFTPADYDGVDEPEPDDCLVPPPGEEPFELRGIDSYPWVGSEANPVSNMQSPLHPGVGAFLYLTPRLHANPYPPGPIAGDESGGARTSSYESWQAAQMHPILARRCSDIIVEFAGDYIDDKGTPRDGTDDEFGAHDGRIDRHPDTGRMVWYSHGYLASDLPESDWGQDMGLRPDSDDGVREMRAFLETPSDGHDPEDMTSYNRAYYRYGDPNDNTDFGDEIPAAWTNNADAIFVFRHDDGLPFGSQTDSDEEASSKWPHLLRIRYRLHGPDDKIAKGRWHEQIIKLPRP
ncbi:MAG: type II secretion system protein [Phycisphaeraceae bacterium]